MGYYTDFRLSVIAADHAIIPETDQLQTVFKKISGYDLEYDLTVSDAKWYDHEKDMRALSIRYPLCVWQLDGEGEEQGDVWRKYFQNGQMQNANARVIIQYDDFDPTKLDDKPTHLLIS